VYYCVVLLCMFFLNIGTYHEFPHIRKTGITNGRYFCQEWRGVIDDTVLTRFMSRLIWIYGYLLFMVGIYGFMRGIYIYRVKLGCVNSKTGEHQLGAIGFRGANEQSKFKVFHAAEHSNWGSDSKETSS